MKDEHIGGLSDPDAQDSLPTTSSIKAFLSDEQRELMDLVDQLRRAGLSSILQLPQIVVCGDQSSGKSSVLEAITEIPFPRKENLCTRFATEIILRRDMESSIVCKINPDANRPDEDVNKLRTFSRSIKDFKELPCLMAEATALMGLGSKRAFSTDVLSIEICGPNQPQLYVRFPATNLSKVSVVVGALIVNFGSSLVDLPGLIHSANKSQSDEDIETVKSLVEKYIKEERTIILAVISAKNDFANQIILKKCRKFDPRGSRTLGLITKPDHLRPGSEYEAAWLDLAQNHDVYLELGWHVVKNRNDNEHHLSFAERNLKERMFLSSGSFEALPRRMKGVDSLRERISMLLYDHLKRELPNLKEELDKMAEESSAELKTLGKSRATLSDQKVFLVELFTSAHELLRNGINGIYESKFFGNVDIKVPVDGDQNAHRLRAVVQYLNIQFAMNMRQRGHKYQIDRECDGEYPICDPDIEVSSSSPGIEVKKKRSSEPLKKTRKQAIQWVIQIMQRSRGRELPGTFNPMLINHLFWDQSEPWETLAREHINIVARACKRFVLNVLRHVTVPEVESRLQTLTVFPELERNHKAALDELKLIVEDSKGHPITYNHYFSDTLQKRQQERSSNSISRLTHEATVSVMQKTYTGGSGYEQKNFIDPALLQQALNRATEKDMDRFSAEQALDAHDAYYKVYRSLCSLRSADS